MTSAFTRTHEEIGEPYHYTECGLDDVYLMNGYEVHETAYGTGVSVNNVDGLHRAIARRLCSSKTELHPRELKFLRKMMDLTQAELAQLLRCDYQTVARWERGQAGIPGAADLLVRAFYLGQHKHGVDVRQLANDLAENDDRAGDKSVFRRASNGTWKQAA